MNKTLAPVTITEDQIHGRSTTNRERVTCPKCEGKGRVFHRLTHTYATVTCGRCVGYGTVWTAAA